MTSFKYKKIFNDDEVPPFLPDNEAIDDLAYCMSGHSSRLRKSVIPDEEETHNIPAGYTYLGQFITHDISFDSNTDRFVHSQLPWNTVIAPESIINKRTPFFDLEAIYGHLKPTNEGEPSRTDLLQPGKQAFLDLGETGKIGSDLPATDKSYPNDLIRKNNSAEVRVVDARNDENLILAQTQVAFTKFHNAIVAELIRLGGADTVKTFEKARRMVIRYYQRIVIDDYLPRMVKRNVLNDVLLQVKDQSPELFYQPDSDHPFLPFEFTGAAFRFGHSLILGSYNINKLQKRDKASLDKLMLFTGRGRMNSNSLTNRVKLPSSWIINWYLFYDLESSTKAKFNWAARINSEISQRLQMLVPSASDETGNPLRVRGNSVSAIDLFRGRALKLPSGQALAQKLRFSEISEKQMRYLLTTKKIDGIAREESLRIMENLANVFSQQTPLWFYILAEAEIQKKGRKLGELGSRLVAEVMIKLISLSPFSVLQTEWEAGEDFLLKSDGTFGMPEMLRFIRDTSRESYDELNPVG